MEKKEILGLVEEVIIKGTGKVRAMALIDTGATRSSVDTAIATKAGHGPVIGSVAIKKAHTFEKQTRVQIAGKLILREKSFDVKFTVSDRSKMFTPVLIGRDVLFSNFLVDVEKTHSSNKIADLRERGD